MDDSPLPAIPDSITAAWVFQNLDTLAQYCRRVKAMENLTVVVTKNGVQKQYAVKWSGENATVSIDVS